MAEGDRPKGGGRQSGEGRAAGGLRVFRGGGARRASAGGSGTVPTDVTRRLAALERRVERALAVNGVGTDDFGGDVLGAAAERVLAAMAAVRRWRPGDVVAAAPSRAEIERRALAWLVDTL